MPGHVHRSSMPISNRLPRSQYKMKKVKTLNAFIPAPGGLPAQQVAPLARRPGGRGRGEA